MSSSANSCVIDPLLWIVYELALTTNCQDGGVLSGERHLDRAHTR